MSSSTVTSNSTPPNNAITRIRSTRVPQICRCGTRVVIRVSRTRRNPGRRFFTCPNSTEEDNTHLFKWVDEALLEEVNDMTKWVAAYRLIVVQLEEARKSEMEKADALLRDKTRMEERMQGLMEERDALIAKGRKHKNMKFTSFMLGCVVGVVVCCMFV